MRARARVTSFILKGLWGSSRARAWVGFGFWRAFQISFLYCCPSLCLPFFVLPDWYFLFCLFVSLPASCSVSGFVYLSIFLWIVHLLTCLSSFVRLLLFLLLLCVIFLKIKSASRLQIQNITWNLKCRRQKTIIKLYEVVKFAENLSLALVIGQSETLIFLEFYKW